MVTCQRRSPRSPGKVVTTLEGCRRDERDRYADAFAARGGLQCGFCIPGIVMRAKAQIDKKGADLDPRRHGPPPRRPPLPLHRLREDPRRHRGSRARASGRGAPRCRRRRHERRRSTRPASSRSATAATSTTSRVPGHAARRAAPRPTTPGPTSSRIDIDAPRRRRRASSRVFTAADIPGELRVGIIHKDWPVMIPVGGRTSYAGDVLADRRGRDRAAARARGRARRRRRTTCCAPITDPVAALDDPRRSRCGAPTPTCCRARRTPRGDVDAALARQRPRRARDVPDPAHRARLPRARVDARRAGRRPDGRALHVYSGGQGVWDDRNQIAVGARRRRRRGHRRAGVQRRRVRRQGGHDATRRRPRWRPGSLRPPGEVHAVARGDAC